MTKSDSFKEQMVVIFDGECNMCDRMVNLIARQNLEAKFMWAQHAVTTEFLKKNKIKGIMTSWAIISEGKVYRGSDGVAKAFSTMGWIFYLISLFILLFPHFIREPVYKYVASKRYGIMGKKDRCEIPPKGLKKRFLHPVD